MSPCLYCKIVEGHDDKSNSRKRTKGENELVVSCCIYTLYNQLTFACASHHQALAFTSKRPGKTQQFNYFMMNNNTENAFYLVDMPGMGYAKVYCILQKKTEK